MITTNERAALIKSAFDEAAHTLQRAQKAAKESATAAGSPPRYVSELCDFLGRRTAHLPTARKSNHVSPDDALRKIHDFYGWKAKGDAESRGACAGTIYRSLAFMRIKAEERNGSRPRPKEGVTAVAPGPFHIHVEHTVPIQFLLRWMTDHAPRNCDHEALHKWIVDRTVCTALTRSQEKQLATHQTRVTLSFKGARRNAQRIDSTLKSYIGSNRPFARYVGAFEASEEDHIYDITTGQRVDFERFTFDDHRSALDRLSIGAGSLPGGLSAYSFRQFIRG